MSRGQSTQAFNTASNENATDFGNAQSAFGSTENAIGNYNNQLANFVSGNPYTKGGEYDQTINTGLANVSDAGSNSLPTWPMRSSSGSPVKPDITRRRSARPQYRSRRIRRSMVRLRMRPIAFWVTKPKRPKPPASGMRSVTALREI
jgi:hypothetical protein